MTTHSSSRFFHRPVRLSTEKFEYYQGGEDPALREEAAEASALALVTRGRSLVGSLDSAEDSSDQAELLERLVTFTDEWGIETLAMMWSAAPAISLPGALWRMYALRDAVQRNPDSFARAYERGIDRDVSDVVVAGVPDPPTPSEVVATVDEILAGLFVGDFDVALERCAAFAKVCAAGLRDLYERGVDPASGASHEVRREHVQRHVALSERAASLDAYAGQLQTVATQWRAGHVGLSAGM
ncbi:MAG: histone acetyltransferase [Rothia sp. (in: high G+C Gram-positive bacteria)]|uniref:histone acetyltransferase n=1 Tax=Rothia sp. (in: high G+C Gram-positive bacteria) TaxID=1885016 RepID=UPI0026DEEBF6|nr:histone acetyltransferase [Rothia sp. (in: high G+C Gram-positive bacteria)]MDO5749759.1 histone acetyltransferase [Rothia sp. (in: high G+C Gram-positive bacteria)]